jgi:hypothetical protein
MFVGESFYTATPVWSANFGNPSFSISSGNSDGNGYGNFEYAPPSGYLALCTQNLATALSPTIDDGSQYFNTVLYTGDGSNPRSLTGVGFQPDFTWIKNRTDTWGHGLADSTRGGGKTLITNSTAVEQTNYTWGYVNSFDSDGFTVTNGGSGDDFVNQTSDNYVSWNWLANGGTTSSNTDGDITTTVQASQTSGFSIVSWNEGAIGTPVVVGHGLGGTPEMIILKRRDGTSNWHTWHQGLGDGNNYLLLNTTNAKLNDSYEYISNIGSSTVQIQGGPHQYDIISYFFRGIEGYSKFGSYTANGSTDGVFLYTGFRPSFLIVKITSTVGDWILIDNKRSDYNVANEWLNPNSSSAEQTSSSNNCDFLSNGIKLRSNNGDFNFGSNTYIYMAFAENPFVTSSGVPVVAR